MQLCGSAQLDSDYLRVGSKSAACQSTPRSAKVLKLAHENGEERLRAGDQPHPPREYLDDDHYRPAPGENGWRVRRLSQVPQNVRCPPHEAEVRESVIDQICGMGAFGHAIKALHQSCGFADARRGFCGCMRMTHSVWRQRSGRNGCGSSLGTFSTPRSDRGAQRSATFGAACLSGQVSPGESGGHRGQSRHGAAPFGCLTCCGSAVFAK